MRVDCRARIWCALPVFVCPALAIIATCFPSRAVAATSDQFRMWLGGEGQAEPPRGTCSIRAGSLTCVIHYQGKKCFEAGQTSRVSIILPRDGTGRRAAPRPASTSSPMGRRRSPGVGRAVGSAARSCGSVSVLQRRALSSASPRHDTDSKRTPRRSSESPRRFSLLMAESSALVSVSVRYTSVRPPRRSGPSWGDP